MYNTGHMNILIESFAALISIVILILLATSADRKSKLNRLFMRIVICNIAAILSDAAAWSFDGNTAVHGIIIVRAAEFLNYGLSYLMIPLMTDYIIAIIGRNAKISRAVSVTVSRVMYALFGIALAFLVISQFNGMYYNFDQNNSYHIQELFWLSQTFGILFLLIVTSVIVRYRKIMGSSDTLFLLSYAFFPITAMIIQTAFYNELEFIFIAATLSIVASYGGVQARQAKLLKDRELELTNARVSVMLSQIQPHFMFNSLTAIIDLCDGNQEAQKALFAFSEYLRVNMDSLSQTQPIHFETELRHVKQYLWLEELRFEEKLRVEYDIRAVDFMLPVLSVQPIVENAVYHGVLKKDTGGTVTIRTEETENAHRITVMDNGAGFDASKPVENDGRSHDDRSHNDRSHLGIANVRSRLAAMCGGTLSIHSISGEGTVAIIEIPKGNT